MLVPLRLPPAMLAVVVMLPVAVIKPPVAILPPVILPVAETSPAVVKLLPAMLPVALTYPAVNKLPLALILPAAPVVEIVLNPDRLGAGLAPLPTIPPDTIKLPLVILPATLIVLPYVTSFEVAL